MSKAVQVFRTGIISYKDSLKLQQYFSSVYSNASEPGKFKNILILTEHHPVYTIGIRTKGYTSEEEQNLRSLGAEFYKTNRGGLITFHGPGQLVAYPILHLKNFQSSVRWYVDRLEETVIQTCKSLQINASRTEDTGIWVGNKKICAIGIHASRYVTTHGIALNCNTDLKWFDHIVPCGLEDKGVTSVSNELKRPVDIEAVTPVFLNCFGKIFECDISELDSKNFSMQ